MSREDYKITLVAARVNAGKTQESIANEMGVTRNTVFNWENGKCEMKPAQFKMYCDLVGVPEDLVKLPIFLSKE